MKQIFTLVLLLYFRHAGAQLVLNELYTDPGSGRHEFFELYNPELLPEGAGDYTLVTFFKTNVSRGFYVLDFPTMTVSAKGFFVGSAARPFNYQGIMASTRTSFSWNDATSLLASGGRLTRWQLDTNSPADSSDGNRNYSRTTPPGLNDLFSRTSGSGGGYIVLLYKRGIIINSAIFGASSSSGAMNDLVSMPPLFVDMEGSSPDFTIDFSTYVGLPIEDVIQESGTDNGFIRRSDGACGTWTKVSAQNVHTPLLSNGREVINARGNITIDARITTGTPSTGSELTYRVSSATANAMPAQLYIYVDNGNRFAQLDENDKLLIVAPVTQVGDADTLRFFPFDQNILIVTKSSTGCIDNTRLVANVVMTPLTVRITRFDLLSQQNSVLLKWQTVNNQSATSFELERSTDEQNFTVVKHILPSRGVNEETYYVEDRHNADAPVDYRIKSLSLSGQVSYSEIKKATPSRASCESIRLMGNPSSSSLSFALLAKNSSSCIIELYSSDGKRVSFAKRQLGSGWNFLNVEMTSPLKSGLYFLSATAGYERWTTQVSKL